MFVLMLLLWIVFNGQVTTEILIFGVIIAAGVSFFAVKFMDYSFKTEFRMLKKLHLFILYGAVLVWEIIKANIVLVKCICKGQTKLTPHICRFSSPVKSDMAKNLLANSITLTPGTITVSQNGDEFVVHCLDKTLSDGIDSSTFVRILKKIEG